MQGSHRNAIPRVEGQDLGQGLRGINAPDSCSLRPIHPMAERPADKGVRDSFLAGQPTGQARAEEWMPEELKIPAGRCTFRQTASAHALVSRGGNGERWAKLHAGDLALRGFAAQHLKES